MAKPYRPIFRDSAMRHYIQKRQKDIMPQFVSPPTFASLWVLLGLLLIAGIFAWEGEIPVYVTGFGVINNSEAQSETGIQAQQGNTGAMALIFLPAGMAPQLHAGLPIRFQIGSNGPYFMSQITRVEPDILSPNEAIKRYSLNAGVAQTLTQPSVVAEVSMGKSISGQKYAGSLINAQIQVGKRRVISLLPGLDNVMGG